MEKLHLSDDQMRTFLGDYGSGRPGEKVGGSKGRPIHMFWAKDDQNATSRREDDYSCRTEYVLIINLL